MIKVGDVYEDCAYHPVYCTEVDGDDVAGISLFDFTQPRSCSIRHCGVRVLRPDEIVWKLQTRDRWLAAEEIFREQQEDYDGIPKRNPYRELLLEQVAVVKNIR